MTDLSLRERLMRNRPRQYGTAVDGFIRELEGWLSDNGLAIVPVKATHPMLFEGDNKGATRTIWAAMVKAAPPAADLLRQKPLDPRDPDPTREGIFQDHNCYRCEHGKMPCVRGGNPAKCEYPRARND